MTLQSAGKLGGRPFAVRRHPETGRTEALVCIDCRGAFTGRDPRGRRVRPMRQVFLEHDCDEVEAARGADEDTYDDLNADQAGDAIRANADDRPLLEAWYGYELERAEPRVTVLRVFWRHGIGDEGDVERADVSDEANG